MWWWWVAISRGWRKKSVILLTLTLIFATLGSLVVFSSKLSGIRIRNDILRTGKVLPGPRCLHPLLPVDNPDIMKHIVEVPPIVCGAEDDWVISNGTHAFVTDQAKVKYENIQCTFTEIERNGDSMTKQGRVIQGQSFKFINADFVSVVCASSENKLWKSYVAGPRANVHLVGFDEDPPSGDSKHSRLNVLMWGHDSLSRNMFKRKMPLTYDYLVNTLKGVVLNGYNIVGDGTPQAVIPILTGKTELELPETRKRMGSEANYVNVYPFIWKEYRKKGYLTGFMEDAPQIGTFTYRLKGFNEQPTDFYMRPYYLAAEPHYKDYSKYCIGNIPRHKILMNYIHHIFDFHPEIPKFIFSFHSELSHDNINQVQGADQDEKQFFQDLKTKGILNNTVLIIMSDHGHRFSAIRETQQGKQEERMPMFMFVFPDWFPLTYPNAWNNFVANSNGLTTPFDIHATLQDILRMSQLTIDDYTETQEIKLRQMSLLKPIPNNRMCSHAKIEPHWCACLRWRMLNTSISAVQRAGLEFVDFVNSYTLPHREICSELKLGKILGAAHLHPTEELLQYKKNADEDGFVPDLTDRTEMTSSVIQLKVETTPGNGHFEVSITYSMTDESFQIKESDISRINKYGSQAHCVESQLEHLRKYCYCI